MVVVSSATNILYSFCGINKLRRIAHENFDNISLYTLLVTVTVTVEFYKNYFAEWLFL